MVKEKLDNIVVNFKNSLKISAQDMNIKFEVFKYPTANILIEFVFALSARRTSFQMLPIQTTETPDFTCVVSGRWECVAEFGSSIKSTAIGATRLNKALGILFNFLKNSQNGVFYFSELG